MDIITTPPYEEMQRIYNQYFSTGCMKDISTKFALISLTGYLVKKLKEKKPDVTSWHVLKKIAGDIVPEDYLKGIAVVCDDFAYMCEDFPTFDLKPSEMPSKIKEILHNWLPF